VFPSRAALRAWRLLSRVRRHVTTPGESCIYREAMAAGRGNRRRFLPAFGATASGRSLFSVGEDATRGACDVVGVNVGPAEEFVARSGAWHAADGKMREGQV